MKTINIKTVNIMRFSQHLWVMTKAYKMRPTQYSNCTCDTYSLYASVYIVYAAGNYPEDLRDGAPQVCSALCRLFNTNDSSAIFLFANDHRNLKKPRMRLQRIDQ